MSNQDQGGGADPQQAIPSTPDQGPQNLADQSGQGMGAGQGAIPRVGEAISSAPGQFDPGGQGTPAQAIGQAASTSAKGIVSYLAGEGGMSKQQWEAAKQNVDPDNSMSPDEANARVIAKYGTPAIQAAKSHYSAYTANAAKLLASGNLKGATEEANNGYTYLADGNRTTFQAGKDGINATVQPMDENAQTPAQQFNLTPEQFNSVLRGPQSLFDHQMNSNVTSAGAIQQVSQGQGIPLTSPSGVQQSGAPKTGATPGGQAGAGAPPGGAQAATPGGQAGAGAPPATGGGQGPDVADKMKQFKTVQTLGTNQNRSVPAEGNDTPSSGSGYILNGVDPFKGYTRDEVNQAMTMVGGSPNNPRFPKALALLRKQEDVGTAQESALNIARGRGAEAATTRAGATTQAATIKANTPNTAGVAQSLLKEMGRFDGNEGAGATPEQRIQHQIGALDTIRQGIQAGGRQPLAPAPTPAQQQTPDAPAQQAAPDATQAASRQALVKLATPPPPQAMQMLKEGVQQTFKNGSVWTLRNGQPLQVK